MALSPAQQAYNAQNGRFIYTANPQAAGGFSLSNNPNFQEFLTQPDVTKLMGNSSGGGPSYADQNAAFGAGGAVEIPGWNNLDPATDPRTTTGGGAGGGAMQPPQQEMPDFEGMFGKFFGGLNDWSSNFMTQFGQMGQQNGGGQGGGGQADPNPYGAPSTAFNQSPVYSPNQTGQWGPTNGWGKAWDQSNPFKIGSF